jgi:hypothetical protein
MVDQGVFPGLCSPKDVSLARPMPTERGSPYDYSLGEMGMGGFPHRES